jgi:hypothetical protein
LVKGTGGVSLRRSRLCGAGFAIVAQFRQNVKGRFFKASGLLEGEFYAVVQGAGNGF